MNTITTPVIPVEQLERELQTLQLQQHALRPLQPVEQARNAVIDAQARLAVTPISNDLAVKLEAAQRVLAERLQKRDLFEKLGKDISIMEERLAAAKERDRIEMATRADHRLAKAQAEYKAAQLQCGRAFRSLLQQVARSSNTPGAGIVKVDYRLHLPGITPASWDGTTGQAMAQAALPFEAEER